MFSWIMCIGTWPGPSIMVCTSCFQAILVSSPSVPQLGELGLVVGVGDRAGAQPVAQAEAHVVRLHDLADLFEVRVEEVLLVMGEAPLGHDRAAARDDAGDALARSAGCSARRTPAWMVK